MMGSLLRELADGYGQRCSPMQRGSKRHTLNGRQENADGADGRLYPKGDFHNNCLGNGGEGAPECTLGVTTTTRVEERIKSPSPD